MPDHHHHLDLTGSTHSACPLCLHAPTRTFHQDRLRSYLRCPHCLLITVPPQQQLTPTEELAEYRLHQNCPDDPGYRRFLNRLATPLRLRLPPGSSGLDFGSGPGPTLSRMLEEQGHTVALYDPFFAPDKAPLTHRYDFITATEVVEHFRQPRESLEQIWRLLRPGGWLGIMTKLALDLGAFSRWHYKNDQTHVAFFSKTTFTWLASHWKAQLEFAADDVILLQKPF